MCIERCKHGSEGGGVQQCTPSTREGGVGLEMFGHEFTNILKEMGEVECAGLATTSGEVVHPGDAGVQFLQRLANRVVSPTKLTFGLRWLRPNTSTVSARERRRWAPGNALAVFRNKIAIASVSSISPPPLQAGWHCTDFQRANYFPVIALDP